MHLTLSIIIIIEVRQVDLTVIFYFFYFKSTLWAI